MDVRPTIGDAAPSGERARHRGISPPTSAAFATALPDLAIAVLFLVTWMRPAAVSAEMVPHLTILMGLEFVVVHSAGFMGFIVHGDGTRERRTLWMLLLIGFYSLFALGFSLAARAWWPLASFTLLGLNRTATIWTGQSRGSSAGRFIVRGWVIPTAAYLGMAFVTGFAPLPRLGITDAIVARAHAHGVGGLWSDEPWRVLAFGFLYFTVVGIAELSDPGADPGSAVLPG